MKKRNLFFLAIIFCVSFIIGQKNIDINNFYQPATNKPFITLDPSYNTYYIMSPYNPNIFLDYEMIDLKINASTLSPIGTYKIPPIYLNFMKDTVSSTGFEHNRGDYAYYDNIIFLNNKYGNDLSSLAMIQGRKYDGLQSIDSSSDILQNYFLNITKQYPKSNDGKLWGSISTSLMYHKEDINIPIYNYSSYNRKSDSYLYGTSFNVNYSNFKFNFVASSQLARGNHYLGLDLDEYVNWVSSRISFRFNNYLSIQSYFNSKKNSLESDPDYIETILNTLSLEGHFNYKNINFNVGLMSHYTQFIKVNPRFNFNFIYNPSQALFISVNKKTDSFMNRGYTAIDTLIFGVRPISLMDVYSLKIRYKNEFISFIFEPFYLIDQFYSGSIYETQSLVDYESEISGLNASLSFGNDYFIGDFNSGLYQTRDAIPINFYTNYSILFAPKINNKRFRPFIGIEGVYMGLNPSSYIDVYGRFFDMAWDNNNFDFFKNINLFSFQSGFILNQFKVSYHWINPINQDISFSFSNSYQPIKPFSKFQVTWQFLD